MKHRSTVAFIILAAALFAAPQMAHDVLSIKSAVGARLRGEVVRALFSLSAGGGSEEVAAHNAGATTLASFAPENDDAPQAAPKSKACERRASSSPRPEAQPQKESQEQLAMIVSPSLLTKGSEVRTSEAGAGVADPNVVDAGVIVSGATELSQQALSQIEVASFVPPTSDAAAPTRVKVTERMSAEKCRAKQDKKESEAKRRAANVAACFAGRKFERQSLDAATVRKLASLIPAPYEFKLEGPQRVRVMRIMRRAAAPPVSYNTQLPKQVALYVPAPTAPTQAPPAE